MSRLLGTMWVKSKEGEADCQWLVAKGYDPAWGVGRHVLGSQVFDYWFTPDDFLVEHYSDGDLVNCHTETGYLEATNEALAIWGPAVRE